MQKLFYRKPVDLEKNQFRIIRKSHMMTTKQFETVQKAHGHISEQPGQSPAAFQRERVWCWLHEGDNMMVECLTWHKKPQVMRQECIPTPNITASSAIENSPDQLFAFQHIPTLDIKIHSILTSSPPLLFSSRLRYDITLKHWSQLSHFTVFCRPIPTI